MIRNDIAKHINMNYSVEHIAKAIKAARKKKRMSQRALSAKTGVPQSHISRIENGAVDLKTSSLIEFARALDMELMLVPRMLVPTVQGLQRGAFTKSVDAPDSVSEIVHGLNDQGSIPIPAYRLDKDEDDA